MSTENRRIDIRAGVMARNDASASRIRAVLERNRILGINIISSPGAGKTTLLESLGGRLGPELAVIEGDVRTRRDADRLISLGIRAWQIETGGACHLDAPSVEAAIEGLELDGMGNRFLVVENVGNLICPSSYYLGEHLKTGMLSLPEGDDKILKYPALFSSIDLLLMSKIDLGACMDFDVERAEAECRSINPGVRIIRVSARSGEGMGELESFFRAKHAEVYG
jgi:hydrogenase nickel incorporation protein HypB